MRVCNDADDDSDDAGVGCVVMDGNTRRGPEAPYPRPNPSGEAVDGGVGGGGGSASFPRDGPHTYSSGNYGKRGTCSPGVIGSGGGGSGGGRGGGGGQKSSNNNVVNEEEGNRSKNVPTAAGATPPVVTAVAGKMESEETVVGGGSNVVMKDHHVSSLVLAHHQSPPGPPPGGGGLRTSMGGGGSNPLTLAALLSAGDFYPAISTTRFNTSTTSAAESKNIRATVSTARHRTALAMLAGEGGPLLGSIREPFLGSVREAIPEHNHHPRGSRVGRDDVVGRTDISSNDKNRSTRTLRVEGWGRDNNNADDFGNDGKGSLGTEVSQLVRGAVACSSGGGEEVALEVAAPVDPSNIATTAAEWIPDGGGRGRGGRHEAVSVVGGRTAAGVEEIESTDRKSLDELLREMREPLPAVAAAAVGDCGPPLQREALYGSRTHDSGGGGVVAATSNGVGRICL